jgi:hypothetical protein
MNAAKRTLDVDVSQWGGGRLVETFDQAPVRGIRREPCVDPRRFLRRALTGEKTGDGLPIGRQCVWGRGVARSVVGHTLSTRDEISTLIRIMDRVTEYTGMPLVGTDRARLSDVAFVPSPPFRPTPHG